MNIETLLPSRSEVSLPDRRDPRVLDLDSEDADDVFAALSSSTARHALAALYEEPRTASGLADEIDTSLQNVDYHLRNLQEASLVEVVDTLHSTKGKEMKVYAPTDTALVLFGGESRTDRIRRLLRDALGGFLTLGVGAVLVRTAIPGRFGSGAPADGIEVVPVGGNESEAPSGVTSDDRVDFTVAEGNLTDGSNETYVLVRSEEVVAEPGLPEAVLADPAAVFLLGGVVALLGVAAAWHLRAGPGN